MKFKLTKVKSKFKIFETNGVLMQIKKDELTNLNSSI